MNASGRSQGHGERYHPSCLLKHFLQKGGEVIRNKEKPIFWQVLALWGEIILRLTGVSNVNVRVPGKTGRFSFQLLH